MEYIAVPIDLITSTPNNMELGEKIRELLTQFGGISEQQKPCIQETEEK
jgi:hypothetical protein